MKRYQRQIILPEVKFAGQQAIGQARVLVIGAGGLGTPAMQYLVAAGVGHLTIFDGDDVEESNLHRQVQFDSSDLGKNKATVLGERLQRLNPRCKITSIPKFLDKAFAIQYFPNFDVIIDGTDNFATKYLINDVAAIFEKPVVFGAISQFEGQVSVFWQGRGPCYRCIFPQPPKSKIQNCAEAGVLGPLPGIIGTMQAMECLKVILYQCNPTSIEPLIGQLATFDFASNSYHSFQIVKRKGCLCSTASYKITAIEDVAIQRCSLPLVEQGHGFDKIPEHSRLPSQIIDVRSQAEWEEFHIPGSIHWPFQRIEKSEYPELDEGLDYFCVCMSSLRAKKAKDILRAGGFTNVNYLKGSVYEYSPGR